MSQRVLLIRYQLVTPIMHYAHPHLLPMLAGQGRFISWHADPGGPHLARLCCKTPV